MLDQLGSKWWSISDDKALTLNTFSPAKTFTYWAHYVFAFDLAEERPSQLTFFGLRLVFSTLKVCAYNHEMIVVHAEKNPDAFFWIGLWYIGFFKVCTFQSNQRLGFLRPDLAQWKLWYDTSSPRQEFEEWNWRCPTEDWQTTAGHRCDVQLRPDLQAQSFGSFRVDVGWGWAAVLGNPDPLFLSFRCNEIDGACPDGIVTPLC